MATERIRQSPPITSTTLSRAKRLAIKRGRKIGMLMTATMTLPISLCSLLKVSINRRPILKTIPKYKIGLILTFGLSSYLPAEVVRPQVTDPISVTPNPVGAGARALSLGYAFTSIADDATSANWNPSGLTQLETPEIHISGGYQHTQNDDQSDHTTNIDALNFCYPFHIGSVSQALALSYERSYDLTNIIERSQIANTTSGNDVISTQLTSDVFNKSSYKGELSQLSASYAIHLHSSKPTSLGITISAWEDGLTQSSSYKGTRFSTVDVLGTGTTADSSFTIADFESTINEQSSGEVTDGYTFLIGAMTQLTPKFRLGLAVRPSSKITLKQNALYDNTTINNQTNTVTEELRQVSGSTKWSLPATIRAGMHYRITDWNIIACDLHWIKWSTLYREVDGIKSSFESPAVSPDDYDDGISFHLGYEKSWTLPQAIVTLRTGASLDQRPGLKPIPTGSGDNPTAKLESWYGLSIGCSYARPNWVADFGTRWERGNNVGTGKEAFINDSVNIDNWIVRAGFTYYFPSPAR